MLFHYVVVPRSAIIGMLWNCYFNFNTLYYYIGIGLFFFFIGFISILRIRAYIRRQRFVSKFETVEATEKVGRLMLRISSFSLIYIVPVALGTYSDYYQSQNMDNWLVCLFYFFCLKRLLYVSVIRPTLPFFCKEQYHESCVILCVYYNVVV